MISFRGWLEQNEAGNDPAADLANKEAMRKVGQDIADAAKTGKPVDDVATDAAAETAKKAANLAASGGGDPKDIGKATAVASGLQAVGTAAGKQQPMMMRKR